MVQNLQLRRYMEDFVIIFAGIIAGVVSEIGGAGMLISLPMLLSIGLPPTIANGTNRVSTMALYGAAWSHYEIRHHQKSNLLWRFAIPIIAGTVVGAFVATSLTNDAAKWLIITLSIAMVAFTVLTEVDGKIRRLQPINKFGEVALMVAAGLYCGLIQSSMAYLIFFLLVRVMLIDKNQAEGIKISLAMATPIIGFAIFAFRGLVDWRVAAILFVSSAFGGWLGAKATEQYKELTIKHWIVISALISVVYTAFYISKYGNIF